MNTARNIQNSLINGFVDFGHDSLEQYNPKLLVNDYKRGMKVLSTIENELRTCDEFYFSVAFITKSGVVSLINVLDELANKGIKGKIVASQYQNFTQPDALRRLLCYENIELRIVTEEDFHAKGYIFRHDDSYSFIIGSSNLTQNALSENKEWNVKLSSMPEGSVMKNILDEYDRTFANATVVTEDWITQYEKIYSYAISSRNTVSRNLENVIELNKVNPNSMQVEALASLELLRAEGKDKALLISATGTGKTYLSAFDVRKFKPKKMLFIVHRENILRSAERSFKRVLGNINSGILGGGNKNYDLDYTFAMINTISKEDVMKQFEPDHFDYIVIDEVHRAGAPMYERVIEYFKPKFLLGMTATPERTDGYDIYKTFDHNIAYEIRLQHALEEHLLCPFHYFGITDMSVNGEVVDDETEFRYLVAQERVDRIIENAMHYGCGGERIKGLIFCSRNEEASELSAEFNRRGLKTVALSGADNEKKREEAISLLESDDEENHLDYIFTVDIFNEGIDIPQVNQVIMLRPTQSAIIFVQQLGRGLRKAPNKEYVVILDFIGSYKNNFMIPMALSGDRSYNKDTVRRYVREGSKVIPGCSTVHFDEVSRKKIFQAIDTANFNDVKLIKESYRQLKYKIGKIPTLMDFEKYGSIDPLRIFDASSLGSYHIFLKKYEKEEYKVKFSKTQENILEFISKKFGSGKRIHELLLLKLLLEGEEKVFVALEEELKAYGIEMTERTKTNLVNIMTNVFATGSAKDTYADCILIKENGDDYTVSDEFEAMLEDYDFYCAISDVVEFGIFRNGKDYSNRYQDTSFQLYKKYTYEDVCRLLEWQKGEVALNIGGYKYDKITKTYPVFINYDKTDEIADTIKYEDRLITQSDLIAISKSGRSLSSEDVHVALNSKDLGVDMELFVRKNKDDKISKEFYYLGRMSAIKDDAQEFTMPNTTKTAVEIHYVLDTPVRDDIYDYIVG